MSRDTLRRARQLVRLRDLALDTALRDLAAANELLSAAQAALRAATSARDAAIEALANTRGRLAAEPVDAQLWLARIATIAEAEANAVTAVAEAETAVAEAETVADDARSVVLRARSRAEVMTGRADQIARAVVRRDDEVAAIEAEETSVIRAAA